MRVGTIVSLIASAVLGLGALFVARIWLPSQSKPVAQKAAVVAGVPVVLAAGPIAYGEKVDPRRLTLVNMPANAVPPGAFSAVDQVMKQDRGGVPVAVVSMAAREPVLASKLSGAGARATLAAMIGEGFRAYTIGITEVNGGGGHILPGDRVDVVVTRDASTGTDSSRNKYMSEVVIQNVRVLGMDLNVDPATSKPSIAHTATLEVNVEDAERLALAAQAGTLSLALRRIGSAEVNPIRPMQTGDLGAGSRLNLQPRPVRAHRSLPRITAKPVNDGSDVVVIHGAQRAQVSVPADRFHAGV